ncbi:MAG: hypothetical protein AAF571_07885, partial [Verrucomicrobiota bacterium]
MNKFVKKLALLLMAGSIIAAPFHSYAQEEEVVEVVEETVAAVEPVVEEAAAPVEMSEDYAALLAEQGDTAYAFDFFVTSNLWTVIAAAMVF